MKKLIIIALLMFAYNVNYAQKTTKTITEDFLHGKVTYQYYEDQQTGNYIKHGSFQYTENQKGPVNTVTGTRTANVSGTFKDGVRDRQWTFVVKTVDWGTGSGPYYTGTMNSVQTYKDGVPNGLWKISDVVKSRSRVYAGNNTYTWGAYETINDQTATTTFKDGYTVGASSSVSNGKAMSYTLPNDGMIKDATIYDNDGVFKYEIKYDDMGICLGAIIRDKNGKVIEIPGQRHRMRSEITDRMLEGARRYLRNEISEDELVDYGVGQVSLSSAGISGVMGVDNYFDSDNLIKGGAERDQTGPVYDGKYYAVYPYRPMPSSMHKAFPKNLSSLSEKEQIELLEQFIAKYGSQINDIESVNRDIAKLKSKTIGTEYASMRDAHNKQVMELFSEIQNDFPEKLSQSTPEIVKALSSYKQAVLKKSEELASLYLERSSISSTGEYDQAMAKQDKLNNVYVPMFKVVDEICELASKATAAVNSINISNSALQKFHPGMLAYLVSELYGKTDIEKCKSSLLLLINYSTKVSELSNKDSKELKSILKEMKEMSSDKQRAEYILK